MAALRRGVAHYQAGTKDVTSPHYENAIADLKLNAQEQALYQRHLNNLWGPGGVDNPDGSRSSLYQAVQEHDGKFYNIPTVWNGKIETEPWTHPTTGKVFDVPNAIALQNVAKEGWGTFPSYPTPEEADVRYGAMHDYMDRDTGDYFKQRNDAMAPQLRRGIAHYQEGTEDVGLGAHEQVLDMLKMVNRGISTGYQGDYDPRQYSERGAAHYQEGEENVLPPQPQVATQRQLVTPQAQLSNGGGFTDPMSGYSMPGPGAPAGGFGQLLTGQFPTAQQNPESSQATRALAGFADYINRNIRAQNLVNVAPSWLERTQNFFGGDRASDAALAQRQQAAEMLGHPLVQQQLMNNPDHLAVAEKDPVGYVQSPVFNDMVQRAVGAHAAAAANPKVATLDEHKVTVDKALNANVHPDVAHVAVAPHKYTEDEFVNTFKGIPTATFIQLFGNQLGHVRSPQEKAAAEFFDRMHGEYADANENVKRMEAERAKAEKDNLPLPEHSRYVLWGKNKYDIEKERRDKANKATMDALSQFLGISNKAFVIP